ncbi:MAG: Sec-independent protein translocase protein TatB [Pseudoxanthomonas sp.]
MFDIGFTELLVIAVVALVVLGPERLPKAARFAGLWVRRARAQWDSVKGELERELAAEELKSSLREAQDVADQVKRSVREAGAQVQRELTQAQEAVKESVTQLGEPMAEAAKAGVLEAPAETTSSEAAVEVADEAPIANAEDAPAEPQAELPAEPPPAAPQDDVQPDLFAAPQDKARP